MGIKVNYEIYFIPKCANLIFPSTIGTKGTNIIKTIFCLVLSTLVVHSWQKAMGSIQCSVNSFQ